MENDDKLIKKEISRLCSDFRKRWVQAKRTLKIFEMKHRNWLSRAAFPAVNSVNSGGRPKKSFMNLSKQTKRRRVENLRPLGTSRELALAAEMNARSEGFKDAAKVVQEVMQTSPSRATKIRQAWKTVKSQQKNNALTDDEGLALFIDGDFSRDQWMLLRTTAARCNAKQMYPSYKNLVKARKNCLPDEKAFLITEISAEVQLQQLLNHTAQRILALENKALHEGPLLEELELLTKWGFDGSSDHSNYKQKFEDHDADDSAIFITSMVPLQLRFKNNPNNIIWMNCMPSSTRLCRPIRIQFRKETTALTLNEKEYLEAQIAKLVPSEFLGNRVHHLMICSMIDGKVCSA